MRFLRGLAMGLLLLLALPAASQAQGVGVKGGFLYPTFKFNDFDQVINGNTGWMAGLFFADRAPGVHAAAELNFLQKKGTYNNENLSINYFQIPIFVRGNFGSTGAIGYVFGGPNFDFKIGEGSKITLFNDYAGFDFGLTAGVGGEFSLFIVEIRGTWGLRNIAKDFTASELKTRSFAGLIGIRFH
jgi:hypothetical protein